MVLGKLPAPGRPTSLDGVGQGPTALAVGAGGGCLDIFTFIYLFSYLLETTPYRLKYCLKGSLSPKTTNQRTNVQCKQIVRKELPTHNTLCDKIARKRSLGDFKPHGLCYHHAFDINI